MCRDLHKLTLMRAAELLIGRAMTVSLGLPGWMIVQQQEREPRPSSS